MFPLIVIRYTEQIGTHDFLGSKNKEKKKEGVAAAFLAATVPAAGERSEAKR